MTLLRDWVQTLEQSSHENNGAVVETSPALKLLDLIRVLGRVRHQTQSQCMK
jgi:hypothetical protein